jgi:hypothetical protein
MPDAALLASCSHDQAHRAAGAFAVCLGCIRTRKGDAADCGENEFGRSEGVLSHDCRSRAASRVKTSPATMRGFLLHFWMFRFHPLARMRFFHTLAHA